MKMRAFLLLGFLAAATIASANGEYKILEYQFPAVIQPGQEVVGKVKIEVVTPGNPAFCRPVIWLDSKVDPKHNMDVPADKMTPWQVAKDQKQGDILWSGFILNVPMDFPAGEAEIRFGLWRNNAGKGTEFAILEDATGKTTSGPNFRIPLKVEKKKLFESNSKNDTPLVVKRMAKPTLDGKVDENEWQAAGKTDSFVENKGNTLSAATRAYVGYDEKNLYIAFVCDEPEMAKTGRKTYSTRDPEIYNGNETVYVLVNPQSDKTSYIQFIVDILNQRFDALGRDPVGYNPPWESKVAENDKGWSVEMAIPFGSLGVAMPENGSKWYADFFRIRFAKGREVSAWKPTGSGFESPGFFGTLIFDSVQKSLVKEIDAIDSAKMEYPKDLAGAANEWRTKIASLKDQIMAMSEAQAAAEYSSLIGQMNAIKKEGMVLNRKRLQLSGSGLIVGQTRPYEICTGQPLDSDLAVGPIKETILQDEWVDLAWNLTNVTDEMITVRCSTLHANNDFSEKPDLGKKSYEFLQMQLTGIDYSWNQAMPVATADGRKMWDVIAPIPSGVVRVAPGETAQVWLTLHQPKDASAGEQKFWAVIYPIDGTNISPIYIPVMIKTVSQSITAKRYIDVFTWNFLPDVVETNESWFKAHLQDLIEHGVNTFLISNYHMLPRMKATADGTFPQPFDFSKADRILKIARPYFDRYYLNIDIWSNDIRYPGFIDLDFDSPEYAKAFKTWFAAVLTHLKEFNINNDNLVICPFDESTNAHCLQIAKWIKEVDSTCKVIIDCSTGNMDEARKLNEFTDIWMPHHKHFFQEEIAPCMQMIRDTKKKFEMYYYSEGPNEKAQDPTLFYLAKFWWCYENKLTGFGYWANQYYGNPWYRTIATVNYDTSMVYPTQNSVVPSRRWQAWRRGWQDYNLLAMLQDKLVKDKDNKTLQKMNDFVQEVVKAPGNREYCDEVRNWVKSQLAD